MGLGSHQGEVLGGGHNLFPRYFFPSVIFPGQCRIHHTGLFDSSRSFVLWGYAHDTLASEENDSQYSLYNSDLVSSTREDVLYVGEYGVCRDGTEFSAWKLRELSFNLFPSTFCILQFFHNQYILLLFS